MAGVNIFDHKYVDLIESIFCFGEGRADRTGTGTLSSFFPNRLFVDFQAGFELQRKILWPATTLREINPKAALIEQLWVMKGETNESWLAERGVNYWKPWAPANGDLGPVYGAQMRNFCGVDQLDRVVEGIIGDPQGRRHVITLWNPSEINNMALPPCHGIVIQFYVQYGKWLHMYMHQRSCDVILGLPYNVCQYSFMLFLVSLYTGYIPRTLSISIGDAHIYSNHINIAEDLHQLVPFSSPTLECTNDNYFEPGKSIIDRKKFPRFIDFINEVSESDFSVVNYKAHPKISGIKVSV